MNRTLRIVLLSLFLPVLPVLVMAQEKPESSVTAEPGQPKKSRPKIGVALEGGGALGLAHVGVLQWFEEHHIPIDYVAGTSLGKPPRNLRKSSPSRTGTSLSEGRRLTRICRIAGRKMRGTIRPTFSLA
jgi:patatin-like phospholipase